MKHRTVLVLTICLFLLSCTASATNWKLVYRGNDPALGMTSWYIDVDTIVKDGDHLTCWALSVYDLAFMDIKKMQFHFEVTLSQPRRIRELVSISYDEHDRETGRSKAVTDWEPLTDPAEVREVDFALQHAR